MKHLFNTHTSKTVSSLSLFLICEGLILVLFSLSFLNLAIFSTITTIALLLALGYWVGKTWFTDYSLFLLMGIIVLLSGIGIMFTLSFYLISLSSIMIWILTCLLPLIMHVLTKNKKYQIHFNSLPIISANQAVLLILTLLSLISNLLLFSHISILEAVRSPWDIISVQSCIGFMVTSFLVLSLGYTLKTQKTIPWWGYAILILYFFSSFGILYLVFPIGFGFDPFIHQTTQEIIQQTGTISPKPLYYVGQYSLVLFFSTLTGLSITFFDTMLVILFSLITFPFLIPKMLNAFRQKETSAFLSWISTLLLLLLPLSFLTFSTPQNLSYVFGLLIIIFGIFYTRYQFPFWSLILLNVFQICIHPLSGIPFSVFLFLLYIAQHKAQHRKKIIMATVFIASQMTLWMFYIQSKLSSNLGTTIDISKLFLPSSYNEVIYIPVFYFVNSYHFFLEFITFFTENTPFWIYISTLSVFLFYKKIFKRFSILFITSCIFFLNYAFLHISTSFENLIFYEQADYANRLFTMSLFFLIPFFIFLLTAIFEKVIETNKRTFLLCSFILFSIILGITFYGRYPRHDDMKLHRGFNISQADIQATHLIEQDCSDCQYIVASSQATATAALKTFGFKRYYNDQFYYPIPTGSPLYSLYLDLVYNPEQMKETTQEIFELSDEIDTLYFTINDYWWRKEKVIDYAMTVFSEYYSIDNEVYIFKLKR